jgi:hypothetical protein
LGYSEKEFNMKKFVVAVALCFTLVRIDNACAYQPSGWAYVAWPYLYDAPSQTWYYLNEADKQWSCEMCTGNWSQFASTPLASGWTFGQWPYAFCRQSGSWFYLNEADVQWCYDLTRGQWSRLGEPEFQTCFTGTVSYKSFEGGFFAIEADDGSHYDPMHLPDAYAVDGLRVSVTAVLRLDLCSFHMYGLIIDIVSISTQ